MRQTTRKSYTLRSSSVIKSAIAKKTRRRKPRPSSMKVEIAKKSEKMSADDKRELAIQIREYSPEQIAQDFDRLRAIGCRAKQQSSRIHVGNRVVDWATFPQRLDTIGSKGISFYDFWQNRESYRRKSYVKKYIEYANGQHRQTEAKLWYNLFRFYFTSINCFRPLVAMEYYCMFRPKCVLDMTAGWGGRLVGACALDVPRYVGIDNNESLKKPYERLMVFLKPRTKTEMDFRVQDALTVDYSKIEYDMVLTSPPYYDLEVYRGGSAPFATPTGDIHENNKYDTQFYRPLFSKTYQHLAKGGHYCLNIPEEIYNRVCLDLLGPCTMKFPLKKSDRQSEKKKRYVEYVYIWRK